MSLITLKQHMMQVKIATLASLCLFFKAQPDTLRDLLKHWMRKGRVRLCMKKPACGSRCFKCPSTTTEIYEWVDEEGMIALL